MRIVLALTIAGAIALAALAVVREDDRTPTDGTGAVTLVGDSLNVGVDPYLREALPGWRVEAHDRVGRMTSEGVEELRALEGRLAPVVVVSLGTNDPDGSEAGFSALVDEVVEVVGPDRCLLWATIVRDGAARTRFNAGLEAARAANPNVRLIEWASMVAKDESLLETDLVHGTPKGYALRAEETARAARACPRATG